ncbi:transglutaminase family protein [Sphingomonas sp.]|uniref:transglutaminase family protein n=1 Tax=Sphingomonas sp. TaxID=28214 RepID=UPI003B003FE8
MDESIAYLGLIDEDDIVLDTAALALAALDHPDTDTCSHQRILDGIAARLAEEGVGAIDDAARAAVLARVIAGEHGFTGDRTSYDDPDNADLLRVIDRRRGLPVSLSILYVAAARRIGWEAHALDVPGHVMVLVGDGSVPVIVDPFRDGMIVAPHAFAAIMAHAGGGDEQPAVRHVAAMPNRAVLVRLLNNQATRAEAAGRGRRALELYRRMTVFAPADGAAWWQRARLELADGDVSAARASLGSMLEMTRDADVRARVNETLSALATA